MDVANIFNNVPLSTNNTNSQKSQSYIENQKTLLGLIFNS